MNFLGGELEFIKPVATDRPIFDQVDQCLLGLLIRCAPETIYKLNFFVSTSDSNDYKNIQSYISEKVSQRLGDELLVNVIAQAPLTRKVILEVFTYNPQIWQTKLISNISGNAVLFSKNNTRFLIGAVQVNGNHTCRDQASTCFSAIDNILSDNSFSMRDIIRQWNYIQDIVRFDENNQNYQVFNDVRSTYYGNAFTHSGYPAATGIGMNEGGVIIEFIAMQSDEAITFAVDNPEQIAAHRYSEDVLVGNTCNKATPKFERARFLKCFDQQMMFISGTAAIKGEQTIGPSNPLEQTEVTISNIKKLYSEQVLIKNHLQFESVSFNHCRVYLKNETDFNIVEKICRNEFGDIPMVFIQANICRDNLLVEIEGEVIL